MAKGIWFAVPVALGAAALVAFSDSGAPAQGKKPDAPLFLEGSAAPQPWQRYRDWNKAIWDKYNTLAKTGLTAPAAKEIEIKDEIVGDAKKGKELAFSLARGGGCLACHVMGPDSGETPGNVGPDLSEVGNAGKPDQYLYNIIFDPRVYNQDSPMPPWGAHGLYSGDEIKDMVAFLKTLKTPASFKTALDDPEKRPKPVENRDALDAFVNPAVDYIEAGAALFKKAAANGKACASCHADAGARFKNWAVQMPKWEPRLKHVLGVEEFIYRHAKATLDVSYLMQSRENTELSVYLHSLANGQPLDVDVTSPGNKEAAERGKALTFVKVGQLNFSCVDCHSPDRGANKWIRGQWLGEPRGQLDHFPVWRTSRSEVWDIRKRFEWCNIQVRANELPPDAAEYGELELYLMSLSQGLKLTAPNIRH